MNVNVSTCVHIISDSLRKTIAENHIRYTPFDHEELARVACETMNARNCTLIEKLEEGTSYYSLGFCAHFLMAYRVLQQGFSSDFR